MNYDVKMKELIENIPKGEVPTLLLQSCCAPCSSHVLSVLSPYFKITVLYYNPNIEPFEEYEKRKKEQKSFIERFDSSNPITIIDCDYDNDAFKKMTQGLETEKEGGIRCFKCYELRLRKTAEIAKENNYDYFCTTLTVSPFKNSQKLNEIGAALEKEYDIPYLFSDFKKNNGYHHSIELSKEYNLYRQDYCGCVYSKKEREDKKNSQK